VVVYEFVVSFNELGTSQEDTLAKALELDTKKTHKERCILFYPLIVDFEKCSLVCYGIYVRTTRRLQHLQSAKKLPFSHNF
jgi:hypothetical protein